MASLAKKYFWSNVFNQSLLIAEGGTYAKMICVEKKYSFSEGIQKNNLLGTENITRSVKKMLCCDVFGFLITYNF